jgi:putative NIF3 family GTP cyclohydrolase 1 type 2
MKRLTTSDIKQDIIMKAVAFGVGIYSPHTACDNCVNGGKQVLWLLLMTDTGK